MTMDNETTKRNNETFDFVIVGAGPSAMGLLYGLLSPYTKKTSNHPPFSVAIVERGSGPPHDPATILPSHWYEAANDESSNSVSIITSNIANREMKLPIGKGLGGTSNINACLCMPPLRKDLDAWPEPWKTSLWPRIESIRDALERNNAIFYAQNDMNDVPSPFRENSPIDLTATVPILTKQTNQLDGSRRYERINFYDALVKPILIEYPHLKECLHWIRGTEAQRLLKNGSRVYGIECFEFDQNRQFDILARRAVLLCAGAIETPALLLVSGIVIDGLGKHLQDQLVLPRVCLTPWRRNKSQSLNGIAALGHLFTGGTTLQVLITDAATNPSILPNIPAAVLGYSSGSTNGKKSVASLHIFFRAIRAIIRCLILYSPTGYVLRHFTAVSNLCLMHPYSEGEITVAPMHPDRKLEKMKRRNAKVKVKVGYLKDSRDFDSLRGGSDDLDRLVRYFDVLPGLFRCLRRLGYDWFRIYCNMMALPYYHFCGTCRIQTRDSEDWVVDTTLKLREHEAVYVCDASVFPTSVSNPPALTCASLGYGLGQSLPKPAKPPSLANSDSLNNQNHT